MTILHNPEFLKHEKEDCGARVRNNIGEPPLHQDGYGTRRLVDWRSSGLELTLLGRWS